MAADFEERDAETGRQDLSSISQMITFFSLYLIPSQVHRRPRRSHLLKTPSTRMLLSVQPTSSTASLIELGFYGLHPVICAVQLKSKVWRLCSPTDRIAEWPGVEWEACLIRNQALSIPHSRWGLICQWPLSSNFNSLFFFSSSRKFVRGLRSRGII